MKNAYIRAARPRDFERISDVGVLSLIDDPLLTYFGCTTSVSLKSYIQFILHSSWQVGGVIDMVCVPSTDPEDDEGEKIAAVAIWLPPSKRVTAWNMYTLIRSGILSITQSLGVQGIMRMVWEYPRIAEESWRQGHFCLQEGPQWSHNDTWCCKLAFTAPAYQRQGMMSKMVRERIAKAPESCFTLEATSSKTQAYFQHFDFEIMNYSRVGTGCVDKSGNAAPAGSGVQIFSMIKRSVDYKDLS
ncbi:hypothetical protein BDZ97DRAFT_1948750 [Flammula alnicola]|nr:hypothetical protein BDZ97DRAFT_1948750 [Flammula alnicola]